MLKTEKEFIQTYLENSKNKLIPAIYGSMCPDLNSKIKDINKAKRSLEKFNGIPERRRCKTITCIVSLFRISMHIFENYPSCRTTALLRHIADGAVSAGTLGKYCRKTELYLDEMLKEYPDITNTLIELGVIYN